MLTQPDISDKELKQRWRLFWLHCIFEFSNSKLQKMAWLEGAEALWPDGEVFESSFENCMASYFDTLALDDAYEKAVAQGNVSKEEAEAAQTFHQLAYLYIEPDTHPEMILADEEWLEVVAYATMYWEYLKTVITEPREVALMQKLEKDFA